MPDPEVGLVVVAAMTRVVKGARSVCYQPLHISVLHLMMVMMLRKLFSY